MKLLELSTCPEERLTGYIKGLEEAMCICLREENPCDFNPKCHAHDAAEIEQERDGAWEILQARREQIN